MKDVIEKGCSPENSERLGYFILDTRDRLAYDELMATVVLIGLLGFLLDSAFRKLYEAWSKSR